jgi:hypothetical protein
MEQGSLACRFPIIVNTGLLLVTGAGFLTACSRNVEPGDPDYPIASSHPTQIVDLTIVDPPSIKLEFKVGYTGWGGGRCSYEWGGASSRPYSVAEPLLMARSGNVLHGQVILDKYYPGDCGWTFAGVFYKLASDPGQSQEVILIDPSRVTPRKDDYCKTEDGVTSCGDAAGWSLMRNGPITKADYDAIAASGVAHGTPAYISPSTRSVLIQFHDLDAPDRGRTILSE